MIASSTELRSSGAYATNFAKEFATGYLIGEVLFKHQLQNDFDLFSQSRTADSKLNNFTRLEPVLHLLEVSFDTNIARDVMTEKQGVATRLLYQVFIALNKKQKANLTGPAMETMRPAAPVKLEGVESLMYKERLKHLTPRQTDLNLESLVDRFHQKQIQLEKTAFRERFLEEERHEQMLQDKRQDLINQYKNNVSKKSEMLAKIQAATVHIPKPPPNKTAKAIAMRRQSRKEKEEEEMKRELDAFEDKLKRTIPPSKPLGEDEDRREVADLPDSLEVIKPTSNSEYINKIRKRLNEDSKAREEREKRRRKVLQDQLGSHEAQEEAKREEMLVNRLMRQSQQERRIAVQLLQTRHEKEVIRNNRLLREKEYEERRLKEFDEALNREKEMAQLAKLEYQEQTKRDQELHNQIMAQRAEERYHKHYDMCGEVLGDLVDFSTKVAEYRELTNRLVPQKLFRDWKALFEEGKPLYDQAIVGSSETEEPTPEQILEEERQQLLDEGDFNEYRQMMGEWQPPEGAEPMIAGPPRDNPIVGHIVQRLFNIVHPPSPPPPPPEFPPFPIKACVIGKPFAGKTSCIQNLAENHRLTVLDIDELVKDAIEAHNNDEMEIIEEELDPEEEPMREVAPPSAKTETGAREGGAVDPLTAAETPSGQEAGQDSNRLVEDGTAEKDEGAEKMDHEKPIPDDEREYNEIPEDTATVTDLSSKPPTATTKVSSKPSSKTGRAKSPPKPQPSPRAKLGAKALKILKKGRPLDDGMLVDIMVEAIKRLEEGTGWVMDGFPRNQMQAKNLEKALTGVDGMEREKSKADLKAEKGRKKSKLAPDPKPQAPAPEPGSGLDLVLLFDLSNEACLKRSAGRTYSIQTNEQYQQEFKPPPEGSATGVGKEQVIPVEDLSHDQEQVQHRITNFTDSWPRIEKWYQKIGNLSKIDATQEEETVFLEIEKMFEDTVRKIQGIELEESILQEQAEAKAAEEPPKEEEKPQEPEPVIEPPPEEERSRPSSKKSGSRAGSAKRSGSRGSKEGKDKKASRSGSKDSGKKSAAKESRSGSKSPKRGKSGKKGKSPEPEPEPEPEAPPGTPPPQPGSDEWAYVDIPIEEQLAGALSPYWEEIENTYIDSSKTMFRKIRDSREKIIRYYYNIRKDYISYLKRPDHKQEFVSDWQKDFNLVSDDIRDDEETRGELHQRVDDLRERLWNICDERKEQAEVERKSVIDDGWLDDRLGILSNDYITIMQTEVDRFQDTVRLLKDYYRGMEGKIPDEPSSDYARIPLIELPVTEEPKPGLPEGTDVEAEIEEDNKSQGSKSGAENKSKKSAEEPKTEEDDKKNKIPLVPRRPVSPDPAAIAAKAKADKGKGKANKDEDLPPPPTDPDQKLVFDAHLSGFAAIDKIMASEQAAREAEEAAEREREALKEAEKQKVAAAATKGKKGDKKGKKSAKSRSPSPKKGKGEKTPPPTTPTPPEETETEEEKETRMQLARARDEFFAACTEEAEASKVRLSLIKLVAMAMTQTLKDGADSAYTDMNDWLGARFLKEMESIDQLSEVMRHAIENATKIREELVLQQEEFVINEDMKTLKSPSPPPRPPPAEPVQLDCFTVNQILTIYNQFKLIAPSGILSLAAFQSTFQDLSSLTHGSEQIPDLWLNLSPDKLEYMTQHLSTDGECIDWRAFLLAAAQPWPYPSQTDLLEALDRFKDMDQKDTGFVTREQYERVDLWFSGFSKPVTPAEPSAPYPYDRLSNLKEAFFDMFAEHSLDPPQMDYVSMLLYFAGSTHSYAGFLRALSVVAGTHVPRIPLKALMRTSRPASQASLSESLSAREQTDVPEELPQEDIPESAIHARIPLHALIKVLHHGETLRGDSHRFSVQADPDDILSRDRLEGIYHELGSSEQDPVPFTLLTEHPIVQDIIMACNTYKITDLKALLSSTIPEHLELQSMKTEV